MVILINEQANPQSSPGLSLMRDCVVGGDLVIKKSLFHYTCMIHAHVHVYIYIHDADLKVRIKYCVEVHLTSKYCKSE